jgi:hypothetical protein
MDLVTLSQIANPILQTVFIAVIGLGYYFTVRATWVTVGEAPSTPRGEEGRLSRSLRTTPTSPT